MTSSDTAPAWHLVAGDAPAAGFLAELETTPTVQAMYDHDIETIGFVMNTSRAWAHAPALHDGLFALMGQAVRAASLTFRERGILVTACAATRHDSYCALAWGLKLSGEAGADVAAGVLRGDDALLDAKERALAGWARRVAADPNRTTGADVDELRVAGYDDHAILGITAFVALRIAFSTINGALGVHPDAELAGVPAPVRDAVRYGRPIARCT